MCAKFINNCTSISLTIFSALSIYDTLTAKLEVNVGAHTETIPVYSGTHEAVRIAAYSLGALFGLAGIFANAVNKKNKPGHHQTNDVENGTIATQTTPLIHQP